MSAGTQAPLASSRGLSSSPCEEHRTPPCSQDGIW
jgi:hypothetical protein